MNNEDTYEVIDGMRVEVGETVTRVSGWLPDQREWSTVAVYAPRLAFGGTLIPAGVNWSGLGTSSAADTLVYASILHVAAKLALAWPGPDEL